MTWNRSDIRRVRQIQLKPVLEQFGYRLQPRPNYDYAIAGLPNDIIIKDHYWHCPDSGQALGVGRTLPSPGCSP